MNKTDLEKSKKILKNLKFDKEAIDEELTLFLTKLIGREHREGDKNAFKVFPTIKDPSLQPNYKELSFFFQSPGQNTCLINYKTPGFIEECCYLQTYGYSVFHSIFELDGHRYPTPRCKAGNYINSKASIGARFICVDLDGTPLKRLEAIQTYSTPHMIVETSHGRFQAYYLLAEWAHNNRDFIAPKNSTYSYTDLASAIALKIGADASATDSARVFRTPGFYHLKPKTVTNVFNSDNNETKTISPFFSHVYDYSDTSYELESIDHIIKEFKLESNLNVIKNGYKGLQTTRGKLRAPKQIISHFKKVGILKSGQNYIPEGSRHELTLKYACQYAYSHRVSNPQDIYDYLSINIIPLLKDGKRFSKGGDREFEVIAICHDAVSYFEKERKLKQEGAHRLLNSTNWLQR